MTSTLPNYGFKSTGNTFEGRLRNCDDPLNPVNINLTSWDRLWIVFIKPDGTQTPTAQEMADGIISNASPSTPGDLPNSPIKFSDLSEPSILDQKGVWQYFPAAKFGNNLKLSPENKLFWVS